MPEVEKCVYCDQEIPQGVSVFEHWAICPLKLRQDSQYPNDRPAGLGELIYSIQLRDLFALMAMNDAPFAGAAPALDGSAEWCYMVADAMLKAREKRG